MATKPVAKPATVLSEKDKRERKLALYDGMARKWTGHKTSCARLIDEVNNVRELRSCTCGFFQAWEQFETEIAALRR